MFGKEQQIMTNISAYKAFEMRGLVFKLFVGIVRYTPDTLNGAANVILNQIKAAIRSDKKPQTRFE